MKPSSPIPPVVLAYGLLGLIPFLAPPLVGWLLPEQAALAGRALALYGGLILSFLGGARWALAVREARVDGRVVSLAMIPTLAALAILLLPDAMRAAQLALLALALLIHGAWDVWSRGLTAWYPRLRLVLTLGAVAGLSAGALLLHG
ncbi:DUF3429 domain-containing protein [Caulobacter henricii]|uniref:DUF3429 domain-containing protein n=1 Tax=Caulobacter henricii TaxID=69395 RepID=A0A0P0NVC9_9CAUL|nr:DUF3429 domain-containing protein [Caulobacter henricii]ALL11889.1 hypothetical protein AQ619_00055 [Caulobacter henricii]